MARLAGIGLLVLSVVNVVTTGLMWRMWLDAMETNWAFNAFFADDAKAGIRSEVAAAIVGGLLPAALAVLASARRWPRARLVHLLCGGWVLAYLLLRVPPLTTLVGGASLDGFGGGASGQLLGLVLWFRFQGFPAGALALAVVLMIAAALDTARRAEGSTS